MKSWIGRYVRIKREYIAVDILEDGSTINYIKRDDETYYTGFSEMYDNPLHAIFKVRQDVYGVDLYIYRDHELNIGSVEPSHLIIVEAIEGTNSISHPYVWDSTYFEPVKQVYTWEKCEP